MRRLAVWMGVAVAAGGCAGSLSTSQRAPSPPDSSHSTGVAAASDTKREEVVAAARAQLGKTRIHVGRKKYSDDCSGLVRAVFDQVGIDLFKNARHGDNGVTAIYRFAEANGRIYTGGRPIAGDLVFFHDTYHRRRGGLTHVALVEQVQDDQTVWIIHRVRRGVVRYRMNLLRPDVRFDKSGRVVNDYLRLASPNKEVLTAQLFSAYATVLPIGGGRPVASAPEGSEHYASSSSDPQRSRDAESGP